MNSSRAVVIGAGAVGLFTALELRRRGMEVTVLDAGERETRNCSHGNVGLIVPSHVTPLAAPGMIGLGLRNLANRRGPYGISPRISARRAGWLLSFARHCTRANVERAAPVLRDLLLASRSHLDRLVAERVLDIELHRDGLLMLSATEESFREERHAAELARTLGLEVDILGPSEIETIEPDAEIRSAGGVFYPQDAFLNSDRLMASLRERLEHDGAELRFGTRVTGFRHSGGRIEAVRHGDRDTRADVAILAAGAWSAELARPLGINLPLEAGRGHSFDVSEPPSSLRHALLLLEARIAVNPGEGRVRFGGTIEVTGLSTEVNARRVEGMKRSIARYLPEFTPELLSDQKRTGEVWAGLRPCTPDGLPYLGRAGRYANLVVATGHGTLGISLAPLSGLLAARIAAGEDPELATDALALDRFD